MLEIQAGTDKQALDEIFIEYIGAEATPLWIAKAQLDGSVKSRYANTDDFNDADLKDLNELPGIIQIAILGKKSTGE